MKHFIVYREDGSIFATGICQNENLDRQGGEDGLFVMEGKANDRTQRIVNGKVVDKLEVQQPPELPPLKKRRAHVTNEQWQNVLSRIKKLEDE